MLELLLDAYHSLSPGLRLATTLLAAAGIALAGQLWLTVSALVRKYRKSVDVPVLNLEGNNYKEAEERYIQDVWGYLKEGRTKFRNEPYQLWGPEGYTVIIPEGWVDEIKSVDDSVADNASLARGVIGDYKWIEVIHPTIGNAVLNSLTPKLGMLMKDLSDEMEYALETELPPCDDWTSITINPVMMRLVSILSGRIFVGMPLNRDPEWISASINFTTDLFKGGDRVRKMPFIWKVVAIKLGLIPEVNHVYATQKLAHKRIVPILKERMKAQQADPDWKAPSDMIQWIMEACRGQGKSFQEQAEIQLIVTMAAIHASTVAATNFVYDLVARPEYMAALRKEVDEAWDECDGQLDKKAMAKMMKMDSFLKESQRLNPAAHVTFDRQVLAPKGITFKNGFHLPQGTHFAVAASQLALDANNFDESEEFKGFRFSDLRIASKENSTKFQFVTTNPSNAMFFGHGKHACPGRFFASNEIKLIVATLLRNFDMKFSPEVKERPKSVEFGHNLAPDPTVKILMKRREGN